MPPAPPSRSFSMLAVLLKRRASMGDSCAYLFTLYASLTKITVTRIMIVERRAAVEVLIGTNVDLASFLIPLGVILYTLA